MTTLSYWLGPLADTLPPPDHEHRQTLAPALIGTSLALAVLMIIFVTTRFYTRLFVTRMFGWDDAIIGLAAAMAVGHVAVTCAATGKGTGSHLWNVDPTEISEGFQVHNPPSFYGS